MDDISIEIGRVVRSKKGRDSGRYLMILSIIDEEYVFLVDGTLRKLKTPKRKKIKHIALKPDVLTSVAAKLISGSKVFDAEIRSGLENLGYINKH